MNNDLSRMTFTSLINTGFHIGASVLAMAIFSVWGCTPMKTLDTEVYRPVDYLEAEREAMVSELNATLDEHLDEIHLSLETLELKTASQEAAIKRLTAQYNDLQTQCQHLQSRLPLEVKTISPTPLEKKIEVESAKKTVAPHRLLHHHAEAGDLSPKETIRSIASKDPQAAPIVPVGKTLSSNTLSSEDLARIYTKARALLLENEPEKAEPLFKTLYQNHPKHTLAVNALYWAGECRYSLHDYEGAITLFKRLMEEYPKGIKVPDAMLKTAYAYLSMDDPDRAHHYLKSVVKTYPFSPAGEKAAEKLKTYQ